MEEPSDHPYLYCIFTEHQFTIMADAPTFSSDLAEETWSDSNGEENDEEMDELERQMAKLDVFIGEKNTGALITHIIAPYTGLSRVSAHADWVGDKLESSFFGDRNKGFVAVSHAAFGTAAPILLAMVLCLWLTATHRSV